MLDSIDAAAVRRWCATGLSRLRQHQHEIDDLNVYPVPDGDTGTNMVLTVTAAEEALHELAPAEDGVTPLGNSLHCLARGALLGARGNSGVILSQLLRGLAETLATSAVVDGGGLAAALEHAAVSAYHAVVAPVEGTILTVARAAAQAARTEVERAGAAGPPPLADVLGCAARAAREALSQTPQLLPALARAGVVDAGGCGLVVLLDALVEVVTGEPPPPAVAAGGQRRMPLTVVREAGSEEYAYEVQYLLEAGAAEVDRMKHALAKLGDSLIVVGGVGPGGTGVWNVHVHVNDVGAAVEAGVEAGRPYRIAVTRFADQIAPAPPAPRALTAPPPPAGPATAGVPAGWRPPALTGAGDAGAPGPLPDVERPQSRAVVVVCDGGGLAELFAAEGAVVVTRGAHGAAPSTAEILDAIRATGAGRVVVLPNDPNVVGAANVAAAEARATRVRAGVVPTRSPVQALAALAVRDAGRRFEDDVIAMAEAAGACRYAEVTIATREALTVAGRCHPGDVLALVDGEVNLIGHDLTTTCRQLLDRLLAAGGELVTLVAGAGAPAGLVDALTAHLAEHWPFVEVQSYDGGQPHYPLLVGLE